MKRVFATGLICLSVLSSCILTVVTKEGADEDLSNNSASYNSDVLESPTDELPSMIKPEDLAPLCSNLVDYYDQIEKRTFNAWGGKRSGNSFNAWGGKRNGNSFNAWGGKRGGNSFNAWGGKRSGNGGFNAWGGKRTGNGGFNAWGGKRDVSESTALNDVVKRSNFNPWGGKRNSANFLLSRTIKNDIADNKQQKPVFNPWGGR